MMGKKKDTENRISEDFERILYYQKERQHLILRTLVLHKVPKEKIEMILQLFEDSVKAVTLHYKYAAEGKI